METGERKKVTVSEIRNKKGRGERIVMLTAYDYPTASLVDEAGVDCILVGDSLGMVVLGYENTLPVTMEEMLHHCKAVRRGARYALLVGDLPFMSYQADVVEAVHNAGRMLKEGGMDAAKLEGGIRMAPTVAAIVATGIPVMGHIGLTPQSVSQLGGFRVQGRHADTAHRLLEDALALEEAGCFSIVLESIPDRVAEVISQRVGVPTIGIGAGVGCDGQVLVLHDMLGLFDKFTPRFVHRFADLQGTILDAVRSYGDDVRTGQFPGAEHTFHISDEEYHRFLESLDPPSPDTDTPS